MVPDRGSMLIEQPKEGKLEDREVSIAKEMLARGYSQQYVSTFFSFPHRSVANRRFSRMDEEVRFQNIPTATDSKVQEFIDNYETSLGLVTRVVTSSEKGMIEQVCQDAADLSLYLGDDELLLLVLLRSLRVFVNTVGAEWSDDEFDEKLDALFVVLAETVRRATF